MPKFTADNITLERIKDIRAITAIAAESMGRLEDQAVFGQITTAEAAATLNEIIETIRKAAQP